MSGPFLLVVDFPTPSGALHDQCVEKLEEMARSARETEPGNSKYAILVPREDDDANNDAGGKRSNRIWVLEEYADQASIDTHTSSALVQAINAWFRETNFFSTTTTTSSSSSPDAAVPVRSPTVRRWRHLSPDFTFSRPSAGTHPDPHVVLAELSYAPGGAAIAAPYWRAVVDAARDEEPGTLAYGVLRDEQGEGDRLCTMEVYESEAYLRDVHVPGHAVAANIRGTKGVRTGSRHHVLRKIGGYLYKEGEGGLSATA